jgi:hypothetical protein
MKQSSAARERRANVRPAKGMECFNRKSSFLVYHAIAASKSGTRIPAWSTFQEANWLEALAVQDVIGVVTVLSS